MRFVIADDEIIPRDYLKGRLLRWGHAVVAECYNGLEAVGACRDARPDVVVLDISMPGMNGTDAAEVILAEGTAGVVLFASSQGQRGIIAPFTARGCLFLSKPYQPPQLEAMIAEIARGI